MIGQSGLVAAVLAQRGMADDDDALHVWCIENLRLQQIREFAN